MSERRARPGRRDRRVAAGFLAAATIACGLSGGCGGGEPAASAKPAPRPNIIWIVWDTVRRDHMSVYGHERETTPYVKAWSQQARVYTDCISPGSTTVPSHGSIFTGLLPSEHGANNAHPQLDDRFETIAELLKRRAGYDTYLFSENPHITTSDAAPSFGQGFDRVEHPWQPKYMQDAVTILFDKIDPDDQSSELTRNVNRARQTGQSGAWKDWNVKSAGTLAQRGLEDWLAGRESDKPFFAFINYMEAHRHLIPSRKCREQMLTPEEIAKSFRIDRTWGKTWAYVLGLTEYTDEELELMRKTYDACLLELDDLFRELIESLQAAGRLDNTIVILTSDHGEHLGEHHLLDHQFSVYNELIFVPLIVYYPPEFEAGLDDSPVMTFDLFPTLLRMAGVPLPPGNSQARDLARIPVGRSRLAEYPRWTDGAFRGPVAGNPSLDIAKWQIRLRAFYLGEDKLICGRDGHGDAIHRMFDLAQDPGEARDLYSADAAASGALHGHLTDLLGKLTPPGAMDAVPQTSTEEQQRLTALGYAGDNSDEEGGGVENYCQPSEESQDAPTSQPATPSGG